MAFFNMYIYGKSLISYKNVNIQFHIMQLSVIAE